MGVYIKTPPLQNPFYPQSISFANICSTKQQVMTLQETINKLNTSFGEAENTGDRFSEEQFFQRPTKGKWSAAENIQHLFFSVKPLVGLFGKPELMIQFGKCNRPGMNYEEVVTFYNEKLKTFATAGIINNVEGLARTKAEQLQNLHAINAKFIERASGLGETILDEYQIPHPLLGLLTVREFLYFTHYHTLYHTQTITKLLEG
jgi:DinB family protein